MPATDDIPRHPVAWKFSGAPATLSSDEFWERYGHWNMPEKFEATDHKLFWSDDQRFHVLGMLVEALGTEAVERFIADHADPERHE